jgi:ATP-dependent helicase/nuclease subunit B
MLQLQQKNSIYLTPSRRLTSYLHATYSEQQKLNQNEVFERCQIYPIKTWLISLWDFYAETDNLLVSLISDLQQQAIFEQIISNNLNNILINPSATAKSVMDAYNLMQMYNIPIEELVLAEFNLDTNKFINWINLYIDYCAAQELVDFPKIVHSLINTLPYVTALITDYIYIIGFDVIPPLIQDFLAKLTEFGCKVTYPVLSASMPSKIVKKIACSNEEQEIIMAAKWAKDCMVKYPDESICIVVPNLEQCRKTVARVFVHFFSADAINISAPVALTNYRLIQETCVILDLTKYWVDVELLSQFLRANFIHAEDAEQSGRILFDLFIREIGETRFTLAQILALLKQYQLKQQIFVPNLEKKLLQLYKIIKSLPKLAIAYVWQQKILEIFSLLGWPDKGKFTKNEYQLIATWKNVLLDYLSLQNILQEHSFNLAKVMIRKITTQIQFLPETLATKVNVYGMLEAAGIPFDRIRVLGMNLQAWPPKPMPNPFIPYNVQKKFDLPRSSANRELKIAKRLLDTLYKCSGKELIFSYASVVAGNVMQASRLIFDVAEEEQHTEKIELLDFIQPTDILETVENSHGLSIDSTQEILGGTSVFAAQAECPFKAFAKFRLKAKAVKTSSIGLLPEVRGEILHQVLAKFWGKCQNLHSLVAMSEFNLNFILEEVIHSVILVWQKKLPNTLTDRFITIEKQRIQEICLRWLAIEKKRTNFVVDKIEASIVMQIAQAKVKLRLDRIDLDDQGNLIILDYKTGSVILSALHGERLLAPQLPLYALAYKDRVKCVSFASLKANNLKFIGLAANDGIIENLKISANWDQQLLDWQTRLENIAKEFMAGDARVMPINGLVTCRTCDYAGLCRINET